MSSHTENVRKKYCKVVGCPYVNGTEANNKNVTMFRLPQQGELRTRWISAIRGHQVFSDCDDKTLNYAVCSQHFDTSQTYGGKRLKPGACPNIFPEMNHDTEFQSEMNDDTNTNQASTFQIRNHVNEPDQTSSHSSIQSDDSNANLKRRLDAELEVMRTHKRMKVVTEKFNEKEAEIRNLNEKLRAVQEENKKMKEQLDMFLSGEQHLNDDAKQIMDGFRGRRNQSGDNRQYSIPIRKFSLTMHYHSPRAYRYLREKFDDTLPHPSTLRKWYSQSNIKGEPGILPETIQTLKSLAESMKADNKEMLISLAFDEISVKQDVSWLHEQKRFSGFATDQTPNENNEFPVASKILVFMATVLNASVSIPVSYYCVKSLDAQTKRKLLSTNLIALHEVGAKVINIVFDGDPVNIATCELMGANLNPSNPTPHIYHPADESHVFILLDNCHMLKLIRSTLGDFGTIHDPKNGKIEWKYFKKLVEYREKYNLMTHKLNKHHILYWKNKMNVRLAAQVFSKGASSSMECLRKSGDAAFRDSKSTSNFANNMNCLFDIFNTKRINGHDPFKSAINKDNVDMIFKFFRKMIECLRSLRLQGILCIYSRRHTGFTGYIINMLSAMELYKKYVEPGQLPYLALFYNSQDMLESFFSRIRSLLGANDNPNLQEFKASIRKLLFYNEITSSVFANCEDNLNILTVSSNGSSTKLSLDTIDDSQEGTSETSREQHEDRFEEIEEMNRTIHIVPEIQTKEHLTIAYMAGIIEQKVDTSRFGCVDCKEICKDVFRANEKIVGIFVENAKTQRPCESTYIICKHTHEVLKEKMIPSNFDFKQTRALITERVIVEDFYTNTDFSHNYDHKNYLVSFIIDEYIRFYGTYVARCITLEQQKILIRNKNRKVTHFKGQ